MKASGRIRGRLRLRVVTRQTYRVLYRLGLLRVGIRQVAGSVRLAKKGWYKGPNAGSGVLPGGKKAKQIYRVRTLPNCL